MTRLVTDMIIATGDLRLPDGKPLDLVAQLPSTRDLRGRGVGSADRRCVYGPVGL